MNQIPFDENLKDSHIRDNPRGLDSRGVHHGPVLYSPVLNLFVQIRGVKGTMFIVGTSRYMGDATTSVGRYNGYSHGEREMTFDEIKRLVPVPDYVLNKIAPNPVNTDPYVWDGDRWQLR